MFRSFVRLNPKINTIVEQISQLTLLETSELVTSLKSKLNITEIASPMMAAPVQAAPTEDAKPAASAKTQFNIKLDKFDAASKAKVIREVKAISGMSLVDAKKFVESVPKILKESVGKEDAEKMKQTFEGIGATIILE